MDFKHEASKIGKKVSNNVDTWGDSEQKDDENKFGVYTSQHVMVTLKVAQKWKRVLEGRKAANASQDGGENPVAAKEPRSHRSAGSGTPRSASVASTT